MLSRCSPSISVHSGTNSEWLFLTFIFDCIIFDELEALKNLVDRLFFQVYGVNGVLVEDYDMVILGGIVDSNHVTLWTWDSAGVE